MSEKILNTRIQLKIDTLENWKSSTIKIKNGEVCFATVAAEAGTGLEEPVVMMKVGTSEEKTFSELPWAFHAKASDVLAACKTTDGLTAFVNGVIANAGIATDEAMQELAGKVTTAEGEIDALQADLNTAETGLKDRVTTAEVAIDALGVLVGDTAVATQISNAITELNLANTYEAKGEAAKVSTALETYKTTNDAAVLANTNNITANTNAITAIKDGTTIDSFADVETALAGKEAAGEAAKAEAAAKAYADGLAGNYDEKGAAATAESNAKAYAKEYADGLADNYDAKGDAAQALTDAKAYTDGLVGEKAVGVQISEAITGLDLENTYAAKSHKHTKADITDFDHTHEMSEVNGLEAALEGKETAGAAAEALFEAKSYADGKDGAIAAAKQTGKDAQDDVDALKTYVGTIPSDEKYADITNVISYVNKKAEETLAAAQGGSSETAASVKQQLDNYKSENDTRVQAAEDAIDALGGLVGTTAVADQIATAVAEEKQRAEGIESGLETRLKAVEDDHLVATDKNELEGKIQSNADAIELLTNGVTTDTIDSVNDLIKYVNDHGADVTGMKTDIKAAAAAAAAEKTRAEGVEAELQEAINGVAADVEELAGEVDLKAAQTDLEALSGRVTTIETEHNTESTGLKARLTQAEVDIDALETKVGDKTVAEQISAAIADAKTDASNKDAVVLAEAQNGIAAVQGNLDTHTGNGDIHVTTEDKATWNGAVQTVTAAADSGLKAVKTGTDVAIEIDDSITFVFDCGGAGVTAE